MKVKAFKVYGNKGHRQAVSFGKSYLWNFTEENKNTRIIAVINSDLTETNNYSIIVIARETEKEIDDELNGQIDDGIFENFRVGEVREIKVDRLLANLLRYLISEDCANITNCNLCKLRKFCDFTNSI